ncbi:DUF6491 family protein [Caulobacter sp.]|uniref:DUF6491 family protein n=1 Tax=Caulobacter sp. TaxID=78 RepID=UPI001621BE6E
MKAAFLTVAALALMSLPAAAQNNPAPPQVFDFNAQLQAYPSGSPETATAARCFSGKTIAGVNRSGPQTLYIQSANSGVYTMKLTGDCGALAQAERLSMNANGSEMICPGEGAQLIVSTSAGDKQCRVTGVKRLTSGELAKLSAR